MSQRVQFVHLFLDLQIWALEKPHKHVFFFNRFAFTKPNKQVSRFRLIINKQYRCRLGVKRVLESKMGKCNISAMPLDTDPTHLSTTPQCTKEWTKNDNVLFNNTKTLYLKHVQCIMINSCLDTVTVDLPFFPSHPLLVPGSFPGWTWRYPVLSAVSHNSSSVFIGWAKHPLYAMREGTSLGFNRAGMMFDKRLC